MGTQFFYGDTAWQGNLQFISHKNEHYGYLDGIALALEGGCKWIQLRMKGYLESEVLQTAIKAKKLCRKYSAILIIDDYAEIALEIADGVHLGKNDMPISEARKLLGKDFIIGGTANTMDDVRNLYAEGADYIGCGPFRFTTTKEKLSPILGIEGYRNIVRQMHEENVKIPLVAIGGILLKDVGNIMKTGVNGIAVSGAILNADDPAETTKCFLSEIVSAKNK